MTGPSPAAIAAAGMCLAEAELGIRRGTVREAAERAYTPSGPPLEELERQIRAIRAADQTPDGATLPRRSAGSSAARHGSHGLRSRKPA